METLHTLVKQGGKVIYIPGNHDAEVLFKPEDAPKLGDSENIHNRVIEVVPGLVIGGFGGSLPTLFRAEGATEFVNVFNPYPYENEQIYKAALKSFWDSKVTPALAGDTQIILMTHDGPQDAGTCNARAKSIPGLSDGLYRFGSEYLASLLQEQQTHLVCNIHGHNHYGAFTDYVRQEDIVTVPIINPGSLNHAEYGEIHFEKINGKWKVTETTKKFL